MDCCHCTLVQSLLKHSLRKVVLPRNLLYMEQGHYAERGDKVTGGLSIRVLGLRAFYSRGENYTASLKQ